MRELFIFLFFVLSIPTLMVVHSDHEIQSNQDTKIRAVNFTKDGIVIYNKIVDEVGITMFIYREAIILKKVDSSHESIEIFKKDNQKVLENLNIKLKLCLKSNSKEDFFNNLHNMTLIAIEYEIKYNITQKDKHEIRKKYFDIYKSVGDN